MSLLFGSMMLIDSPLPELQIGLRLILPVTSGRCRRSSCSSSGSGVRAQRSRPVTGDAGMLGEVGQALTPIDPGGVGRVRDARRDLDGDRPDEADPRRAIPCVVDWASNGSDC